MKKSSRLHLLLMGSTSITFLSCCDGSESVGVFSGVSECVGSGFYTQEQCTAALEQAQKEHPKVAPKYTSREVCEVDFGPGKCESAGVSGGTSDTSGSFWMPLMMGYLVSNVLSNLNQNSIGQPLYRSNTGGSRKWNATPWSWSDKHTYTPGNWHTANNTEVARQTGLGVVNRSALRSSLPTTTTILRGGFGSRATSIGIGS